MKKIAIVGAGLSGLTLAHTLSSKADITLFEKSRGIGGRMSTRYAPPFAFDHGLSYWTAQSIEFLDFLTPFMPQSIQSWKGSVVLLEKGCAPIIQDNYPVRFVATPHMNSLCKALALKQKILTQFEVRSVTKEKNRWHVRDSADRFLGPFDWVVCTLPYPQMLSLFQSYIDEKILMPCGNYATCYALMVGSKTSWTYDWSQAIVKNSPIKSIYVDSTKPHRDKSMTSLTIHTCENWSANRLQESHLVLQQILLQELIELLALDRNLIEHVALHRWLYAQSINRSQLYSDYDQGMILMGDWSCSATLEHVWRQATTIAKTLLEIL